MMQIGLYYIDVRNDNFRELCANSELKMTIPSQGRYKEDFIEDFIAYISDKDAEKVRLCLAAKKECYYSFENKNNEKCELHISVGDVEEGKPVSLIIAVEGSDINTRIARLTRLAYYDSITDGWNFNYFKEQLHQTKQIDGCMIAMNVRGFKAITTAIGVEKTNCLIKAVWEIISHSLGRYECAAHILGAEFVIFMTEIERNTIIKRINEMIEKIREIRDGEDDLILEPYFGVISWNGYSDIETTYSNAKNAINIKHDPYKHVGFFDYDLEAILQDQGEFEQYFDRAIKNEEFVLCYQPKFDAKSENIVEAEALVRWNYNGRTIMPNDFIPLFEDNGMISVLDQYVFRKVCKEQRSRLDSGVKVVPVSVNLSRKSLYTKDIVEKLKAIIDEIGVDKKFVPIEITETAELDNSRFLEINKAFKEAGFKLQLDDFGTGYCSLDSLIEMEFATLKLDKTLIDHIGLEHGNSLLTYSIQLAKSMGMKVTAEGVETLDQLEFLKDIGCDSIQGFLFSRPLSVADYYERLK